MLVGPDTVEFENTVEFVNTVEFETGWVGLDRFPCQITRPNGRSRGRGEAYSHCETYVRLNLQSLVSNPFSSVNTFTQIQSS